MDSQSPRLLANQLRWDLTAEQIENMAAELTERTRLVYDRVGAQEQGEVSYENTLKALADVEVEYTGTYTEREYWLSGNQCVVIKILLVFFFLCTVISFFLLLAPSAVWWGFFFQLMFIQLDISTKSRLDLERKSESKTRTALWRRHHFGSGMVCRRSSQVFKVVCSFYVSRCISGYKLCIARNGSGDLRNLQLFSAFSPKAADKCLSVCLV